MFLLAWLFGMGCTKSEPLQRSSFIEPTPQCVLGMPERSPDGTLRLAVVVGVGRFRALTVPPLAGPPADAALFRQLLVDGYGFPNDNVCMLTDEQGTTAAFRGAMDWMTEHASGGPAVAVLTFAGHGSQAPDVNRDEVDGWDETLVFHDSRTRGTPDLLDDELNEILARLHAATPNSTVIVDACNSGSATRSSSRAVARFAERLDGGATSPRTEDVGAVSWMPSDLPGLVMVSAARDGTTALEIDGRGVLTGALARVLAEGRGVLSWAQVARRTPKLVAAQSPQVAYFQGRLDRSVFGLGTTERPLSWEVTDVGPPIEIGGVPIPGWSKGAVGLVFDGQATSADLADASRAKGQLMVRSSRTISAKADPLTEIEGLEEGDLVVLWIPGEDSARLSVRIPKQGDPDGLPDAVAQTLRSEIEQSPASRSVLLVQDSGTFEVVRRSNRVEVLGPTGEVRRSFALSNPHLVEDVGASLVLFARQRALLDLGGTAGAGLADQTSLKARLVRLAEQPDCATGEWAQAEPGDHQILPECTRCRIEVSLSSAAQAPVLVGAVVLSSDGGIYGYPKHDQAIELAPGDTAILPLGAEFLEAGAPFGVAEHVLVFGTPVDEQVYWSRLSEPTRSLGGHPFQRLLLEYMGATRGLLAAERVEPVPWAVSHLSYEVAPNASSTASP